MDGLGDLSGKHVLVTGATTGIGAHVARALATGGARLWVHGRDPARTAAAAAAAGPGAVPVVADFERLRDVRALAARMAEETDRLDVLVNNAGLIRDRLVITEDGVESTFGVNHLAPFVLTLSLLSLLQASPAARIVTVASRAHRQSKRFDVDDLVRPSCYETLEAYARSKTCNILFTRELARRLAATPTTANCVHPGFVASRFGRDGDLGFGPGLFFTLLRPIMISVERGADTPLWLATSPEVVGRSGGYHHRRRLEEPAAFAKDATNERALWVLSERLTGTSMEAA